MDGWGALGRIADVVTILAALLAFFGLLTTWLTRPRIEVVTSMLGRALYVSVQHTKGSSPARNLYLGLGFLDDHGIARAGDGLMPWASALLAGDSRLLVLYDPEDMTFGNEPNDQEMRFPLGPTSGVIVDISWQRPILPWLRTRRVLLWPRVDRAAGRLPALLKGRAAERAYRFAMPSPA